MANLSSTDTSEFLNSHKDAFLVFVFDAEFTGQKDIVKNVVQTLDSSLSIKDKIVVKLIDVEENNALATTFSVLSVPSIVCVANGQMVRKIDTLEPTKLLKIIEEELKRHVNFSDEHTHTVGDQKKGLNEYLKKLINRAPVMIFMKGEPRAPRCGFSKQLVELLSRHNITYETFDILLDDEVRQGLKEYSDWPTYPQVYAKGEFVGGLDILKELEATNELEATLKV